MHPDESTQDRAAAGNGDDIRSVRIIDTASPDIMRNVPDSQRQAISVKPARGAGLKLGVSAVLVAACLTGGFFLVHYRRSRAESELADETLASASAPISVDVVRVTAAPATQTLTLPGNASAWYESTIYARVNGYLAKWSADIGDRVTKGQVLATIDTPELDDQLAAAQARLQVSQAQVAVVAADSDLARSNYERWRDAPKGVVSELESVEKKADYDSSLAKVKAAEAEVAFDQADVNRLTELTNFKQVVAPYHGVITARRIDIGDLITAGSTASTTSLYSIAQADKIRVFVDVPQSAAMGINVGMNVVATTDDLPGLRFPGTVARTSSSIDRSARTLRVEADIPNPDLVLLPGMYVQVRFELKQNPLLQIPASALLFQSGGTRVAVVDSDGVVHFHDVSIASDQGEYVDISSGLSPDDRVALNISSAINDGDHVTAVAAAP